MPAASRLFWITAAIFVMGFMQLSAQHNTAASDPGAPGPNSVSGPTASAATSMQPPHTRTDDVVDEIHGVKVPDPYRWLEDGNSAESQQYVREQMEYTRSVLDKLPGRDATHARSEELLYMCAMCTPPSGGRYS